MIRISNTKKEQVGGFRSLEIIKLTDVLNCPHILTNANANQFTYNQFFESDIEILPVGETINMVAKPVRTASGIKYKATSGFEVKHLDAAVDTIFNEYHLQPVMVKGTTFNNNAIIFGSLLFPLKFYYEVFHSKQLENPSKFIISCKAEISQKPVIL